MFANKNKHGILLENNPNNKKVRREESYSILNPFVTRDPPGGSQLGETLTAYISSRSEY